MCRLKMTIAQVVEISVTVHNSPVQDYTLTRTIIFHLHVLIHVHVFSRQILKHFSFLLFFFGFVNMPLLSIRV